MILKMNIFIIKDVKICFDNYKDKYQYNNDDKNYCLQL